LSDKSAARNDLEGSERLLLLAGRLCPFNHIYKYKIGDVYAKKAITSSDAIDFFKKSEYSYKEAINLNPMDSWSWVGLADVRRRLLNYNSNNSELFSLTETAYKKALELDPLNSYCLKKFAAFLLDKGDTDLSSDMYKKASYIMSRSKTLSSLCTNFRDAGSYEDMAGLAFSAHDIDKALVYYKMAEEFSDGDTQRDIAVLGQVRCYLRMSLLREGLHKYKDAKLTAYNRAVLFSSIAEYYLGKRCLETAQRFSEKSVTVNPAHPEGYYIRHKVGQMTNKGRDYLKGEISKMLSFNKIPISADFRANDFQLDLNVKEVLYKEAVIGLNLILPSGIYEFEIKAHGKKAANIWPHMIVRFNGKEALDTFVNYSDTRSYNGIAVVDFPTNRFEIIYDNDYYDARNKDDRNLYIQGIMLRTLY
jgi:tetratricopeptide (TPR) repeat protein